MFLSALWKYYYENFVDVFADVTYGYCITTHKSQGSTYENCYVIMSNILTACPKYKDAVRSLYTSVTRPSKSLTLYY
jgi:ATP-dependent exoDNAse (exonuclease V) alpha subunit